MTAAISWSGGKDSWLALARARDAGRDVRYALTMFDEDGTRSRSHAVPPDVMALQARALKLEPVAAQAPWQDYEERLIAALRELSRRGVDTVISATSTFPIIALSRSGSAPPPASRPNCRYGSRIAPPWSRTCSRTA